MRSLLALVPALALTGCLLDHPPAYDMVVRWETTNAPTDPTAEPVTAAITYEYNDVDRIRGYQGQVRIRGEATEGVVHVCVVLQRYVQVWNDGLLCDDCVSSWEWDPQSAEVCQDVSADTTEVFFEVTEI